MASNQHLEILIVVIQEAEGTGKQCGLYNGHVLLPAEVTKLLCFPFGYKNELQKL